MKTVNVFLDGGLVTNIEVPEGVNVIVYDYDVDGVDEDRIITDDLGNKCTRTSWYSNNDVPTKSNG